MMIPPDCPAYILAGGSSSRFGSDKALAIVHGQPQLLALSATLENYGHSVHVVADREDRYQPMGIRCLVDHVPGAGPMAALATALTHRRDNLGAGWILLIGCDQLLWKQAWFDPLARIAATDSDDEDELEAVIYHEPELNRARFLQPIPGLYHSRFLPAVLASLAADKLSIRQLLGQTRSKALLAESNPRAAAFNTRQEFERLLDDTR